VIPFPFRRSIRLRLALVVTAIALVPPILVGAWVLRLTGGSGEQLLRDRLAAAAQQEATALDASWIRVRSEVLDFGDSPQVRGALRNPDGVVELPASVLPATVSGAAVEIPTGETVLVAGDAADPSWAREGDRLGAIRTRIPLYEGLSQDPSGFLLATVSVAGLRELAGSAGTLGSVTALRNPRTGAVLTPLAFDPASLGESRFQRDGEWWLAERARIPGPDVEVVAAAPLAPFVAPFREAGRTATLILSLLLVSGVVLVWIITGRLTASLSRVEQTAAAVAAGDLGREVPVVGDDEVARLAASFNRMSQSLRSTLRELAERESLEAVNEFAAALAHEVRNPLTHIRLDLQEIEEQLPDGSASRELQGRVIQDLERLNAVVEGALQTARSGRIQPQAMDLRDPMTAAVRAARPGAEAKGVSIDWIPPEERCPLVGDSGALEQTFLNLLMNAVEFSPAGGVVGVSISAEETTWRIRIRDRGPGLGAEDPEVPFQPFYTTRPGGTGVGLGVARRIVVAHRGAVRLLPGAEGGTVAEVELPRTR
jgi:signal transduction histidine kinase